MDYTLLADPAWMTGSVPGPREPTGYAVAGPDQPPGWGHYTPLIPITGEAYDRLVRWLNEELQLARTERQRLMEDWKEWQRQYWAAPKTKTKDFPFKNAANIVIPITAIAVEAVHARLMNTIWAPRPFWSINPTSEMWVPAAPRVEEWLQNEVERPEGLMLYEVTNEGFMEFCKLGTVIFKSGYERVVKKSYRMVAGQLEEYWYECKNSATVHWVPRANFLIRFTETDPQNSSWCGEEHQWTWGQLKTMALSGRMDPAGVELVKSRYIQKRQTGNTFGSATDYQKQIDQLMHTEPSWSHAFDCVEIWCSFDIDGDGVNEEIYLDYHEESRTILSARYNPNADLRRPYRKACYITVEGRFDGIGICKQNEMFQSEITTIHRQRIDNATVANMRMLVIRKMSGYGPGEPLFPGKIWMVDSKDDVTSLQMGDVYNSSYQNEASAERWSQMRTAANETVLGMPEQGTPGTATDSLTRLGEANKRFNLVLLNLRRCLGLVGRDTLVNYQQFGDKNYHWIVLQEDGLYVHQFLTLPEELASAGASVEVTASDQIVNQQVEQQQWMALSQILERGNMMTLQLAQMAMQLSGDPTFLLQVIQRTLYITDEVRRKLLHTFNVQDINKLTFTQEGEVGSTPTGGPAMGQPQLGPGGGLPGNAGPGGMGNPLQMLAMAGGNGNGGNGAGFGPGGGVPPPGQARRF